MFDILIQIGASKLVISALLAGLAWVVQRRVAHPAIAYSLWLLVLVTLLIPAVVSIPVLPGQTSAATVTGDGAALAGEPKALSPVERPAHELAAPGTSLGTWIAGYGKAGFALAWLVGTVLLLGWTLARVWRFRRWLIRTSRPAPPPLLRQVAEIGGPLRLSGLACPPPHAPPRRRYFARSPKSAAGSACRGCRRCTPQPRAYRPWCAGRAVGSIWSFPRFSWWVWTGRSSARCWRTSSLTFAGETTWCAGLNGWPARPSGGIRWHGGPAANSGLPKKRRATPWA